ncbi:ABC transporter permease [Rarispira pelagica]
MSLFERLGNRLINAVGNMLYALGYTAFVLKSSLSFLQKRNDAFRVMVMQILFTGVEALSVISVLSLGIGAMIIIQGVSLLPQFGQGDLVYPILITVITRELGPILTAFIVTARSGTAMATEIGGMVVSHEIEAYMSFGIDPISYIVVPRFLGAIISVVFLNIYFNIFGLLGSYFVTVIIHPIPFLEYFHNLLLNLRPQDIIASFVKSGVFGAIIALVGTYSGFQVNRSTTEIPQVAIKAVGKGFVYCIIADAAITLVYYL